MGFFLCWGWGTYIVNYNGFKYYFGAIFEWFVKHVLENLLTFNYSYYLVGTCFIPSGGSVNVIFGLWWKWLSFQVMLWEIYHNTDMSGPVSSVGRASDFYELKIGTLHDVMLLWLEEEIWGSRVRVPHGAQAFWFTFVVFFVILFWHVSVNKACLPSSQHNYPATCLREARISSAQRT